MHGRLKVRTTEEERERKKKEQALKVLAYKAAMTKILSKRERGEYDDEMLQTTLPILQRNPDVYTLWNIRRLCIEKKAAESGQEEEQEIEKLQAAFDTELNVSEQCLVVNPKSYAAWHHRCWTLENCPKANWQREMQLCSKYLKMDERNFHTWDYRRYVAEKAGVSKEQELDFCTEKIKTNFSNYSSWHYRSMLLPAVYPYEGDALPKRPMSEEKLKEELEMVLSAAFTDPNDSSAWFYQRWLLGYSRPALNICAFRCDRSKAVIALTKPISCGNSISAVIQQNGKDILTLTQWKSAAAACNSTADSIWIAKVEDFNIEEESLNLEDYTIKINIPDLEEKEFKLKMYEKSLYHIEIPSPPFVYSQGVLNELQTQLDSCNSLLEFEPDSKWTLLTTALLMRAIDRTQYHEKSLGYLQKLIKVDALRRGYYEDLASKWILEHVLTSWAKSDEAPSKLDLSHLENLISVGCYQQYFVVTDQFMLPNNLEDRYNARGKKMPISFSTLRTSLMED